MAATWELCARVDWMRSFPPHRHLGHDAVVDGERHTFDTTFWPQFHTPVSRIAVGQGLEDRVIHFNYVISTYRAFQRRQGQFHDDAFRLLLIRLFADLFAPADESHGLPELEDLAGGIGRLGEPRVEVAYGEQDGERYRRMRNQLRAVVAGPWSDPTRASRCLNLLGAFDDFYGVARME
jgi:hypothetical protein